MQKPRFDEAFEDKSGEKDAKGPAFPLLSFGPGLMYGTRFEKMSARLKRQSNSFHGLNVA